MHVKSNIKGGVDCTLEKHSLLLGPSGSGKSAIVNSVEFAVSSRLGDLFAREDVSRKDLLAQFTHNGMPPLAAVSDLPPDATLGYRDLKEALRGSPETFWRYVLRKPADPATKKRLSHAKARAEEATAALEYLGRKLGDDASFTKVRAAIREDLAALAEEIAEAGDDLEADLTSLAAHAPAFTELWAVRASAFVPKDLGRITLSAAGYTRLDVKIGLRRESELDRGALSGAEFNIVLTALAIALNDSPRNIIIPDDRAISSLTLSNWMSKLVASKCQIILTSVAQPKTKVDGFHVVNLVKRGQS